MDGSHSGCKGEERQHVAFIITSVIIFVKSFGTNYFLHVLICKAL